jgi:hypothetical protein
LVLKAKVHSASIMDFEGIKMLLRQADVQFPKLKHLWLDRQSEAMRRFWNFVLAAPAKG